MPYKGQRTISLNDRQHFRLKKVKGNNTYAETVEALVEIAEMVRKLIGVKKSDAVSIKKELERVMKSEGLL